MKICRNKDCKEVNPQTYQAFVKDARYRDGYQNRCKSCQKKYDALRFEKNREEILTRSKFFYNGNLDKVKARHKEWRLRNKDYIAEYVKTYRALNPGKELAKTRKYQLAKLNSMPEWLSEQHLKEIERIYRECPEGYEVDHIIPIQGKNVKGLHVPWNLQYLTVKENRSKGSKY